MQPDLTAIVETLDLSEPVVGLYDAPDPAPFAPLVEPGHGRECVFAAYPQWRRGRTLHLTRERHGCGALHLLGLAGRSRADLVRFLVDDEGLRASRELMAAWLDAVPGYRPRHGHLLLGPLRPDQYDHLVTATFYVNPDQLAALCTGAAYFSHPDEPAPVLAPFGSGCGQLAAVFPDLAAPQAVIGATDQAMRRHLPPQVLAFTVTRAMLERLARWAATPGSSLHTGFLAGLVAARGGTLAVGEGS